MRLTSPPLIARWKKQSVMAGFQEKKKRWKKQGDTTTIETQ